VNCALNPKNYGGLGCICLALTGNRGSACNEYNEPEGKSCTTDDDCPCGSVCFVGCYGGFCNRYHNDCANFAAPSRLFRRGRKERRELFKPIEGRPGKWVVKPGYKLRCGWRMCEGWYTYNDGASLIIVSGRKGWWWRRYDMHE
jgi:hypothetical protein